MSSYLNNLNTNTSNNHVVRGSSNSSKPSKLVTASSGSSRNKASLMAPMATKNTKTRNGYNGVGSTLDMHTSTDINISKSI